MDFLKELSCFINARKSLVPDYSEFNANFVEAFYNLPEWERTHRRGIGKTHTKMLIARNLISSFFVEDVLIVSETKQCADHFRKALIKLASYWDMHPKAVNVNYIEFDWCKVRFISKQSNDGHLRGVKADVVIIDAVDVKHEMFLPMITREGYILGY